MGCQQTEMAATFPTLMDARALDDADPFPHRRHLFALPEDIIYLDGNSLGPLPAQTVARLEMTVNEEWGRSLIRSWNDHDWIGAPARVGNKIATLIGAQPGEVIVADSTSVNLYKILSALVRSQPTRSEIVTEKGNFPTDHHIAETIADMLGKRLVSVDAQDIPSAIGTQTAAAILCHVHYRTGARHDLGALTSSARQSGAPIIWDLSHSVGAVPLNLNADGAEYAVGCGYKYLNGGPGAPAFLYVARDLLPHLSSPISGWMGHTNPFAFEHSYRPASGIERFLAGTPPIISLMGLESGIDLMLQVDQDALFEKAQRLFSFFADLMAARCPEFRLISPAMPESRGSQIAFAHAQAAAIMSALISDGVVGDHRAPDVLRFGLTPLYLRFQDIWYAVDRLAAIMAAGTWQLSEHARIRRVT